MSSRRLVRREAFLHEHSAAQPSKRACTGCRAAAVHMPVRRAEDSSNRAAAAQTPAAMPLSPILGGEDALGALERDLDDRLRADAWRPAAGPSPWQVRPAALKTFQCLLRLARVKFRVRASLPLFMLLYAMHFGRLAPRGGPLALAGAAGGARASSLLPAHCLRAAAGSD